MLFHPRIDGGIALDSAVESQQFRFHGTTILIFCDTFQNDFSFDTSRHQEALDAN
jgi:hypothetical protein